MLEIGDNLYMLLKDVIFSVCWLIGMSMFILATCTNFFENLFNRRKKT